MIRWLKSLFTTSSEGSELHKFHFFSDMVIPDVWMVTFFTFDADGHLVEISSALSKTKPHAANKSITITTYLGVVTISIPDDVNVNIRKRQLCPSDYHNNSFTKLQWQEMTSTIKPR